MEVRGILHIAKMYIIRTLTNPHLQMQFNILDREGKFILKKVMKYLFFYLLFMLLQPLMKTIEDLSS